MKHKHKLAVPAMSAGTPPKKSILLIQPENAELHRFRSRQLNNFVQITMPYLAAFVDESQFDITLVDEYNQNIPFARAFDLVAITVNTPNAPHCYQISRAFQSKGSKIVMGGPHATLLPDEVSAHCDYVLTGECEETWPQFLDDFVHGVAKPRYTSDAPPDLRNIPLPRWDLLKRRSRTMKGAVIATRGCPHHCRYCNLKQIYFDAFRTRPIDQVIREISAIPSRFFVFWDDNFFADPAYALALMRALRPLKKKWAAQVTLADCGNDALLEAARQAGCLYVFVGLESFSELSLQDAGKAINRIDAYQSMIENLHRHHIMIQAGIVFGFDHDMPEVFEHALRAGERLGIDGATVSLLTPLPQTPVYHQLKAEGRLLDENWSRYNGKTHVAFIPKNMTTEALYRGYMRFRKRFYSLPCLIRRMRVSKTHRVYNLLMNLGYRLAIRNR